MSIETLNRPVIIFVNNYPFVYFSRKM